MTIKIKIQLKLRKEKIETFWDEFNNIQSRMDAKDTNDEQLTY